MKAKFGTLLIILGSALILAALALFLYNNQEQTQAEQAVDELMPQLVEAIREKKEESPDQPLENPTEPVEELPEDVAPTIPQVQEMATVEIDGREYIGFLGIPALELELPVMADWSYPKLKIAPCRFFGSIYTGDLVVMAHNYRRHFGNLSELRTGDTVTFTDVDGQTLYYEVVALDVLYPKDVEEMTAGEYDLTLFTCTYGGKSRVTIRCDRVGNSD